MARGHRWRQAFLVVALFTLLAGDALAVLDHAGSAGGSSRRSFWLLGSSCLCGDAHPGVSASCRTPCSRSSASPPFRSRGRSTLERSALGVLSTWATVAVAVAIAVAFTWREILSGLGMTLRIILGGSLLFELVVSVFVRHPVLPFWVDYGSGDIPKLLLWSRNELFEVFDGGRIQGIVGNASTLAMIAAIARRGVRGAARSERAPAPGDGRLARGRSPHLAFTRSATITLALVAAAIVLVAALLVRQAATPRRRALTLGGIVVVLGSAVAVCLAFSAQILDAARQERRPHRSARHLGEGHRPRAGASRAGLGLGELLGAVGGAVRRPRVPQRRAAAARAQRVDRPVVPARHPRGRRLRRARALDGGAGVVRGGGSQRARGRGMPAATARSRCCRSCCSCCSSCRASPRAGCCVEYALTLLVVIAVKTKRAERQELR